MRNITVTRSVMHRGAAAAGAALFLGLLAAPAANAASPTNVLTNPDFSQPGTNGVAPTGWNTVDFDNETAPYEVSIDEYNLNGQYPPPAPIPAGSTFGDEVFYESGSAMGSEGVGGGQAVTGVTNADDPQVGFSAVETYAASTSNADWAGSVFEVDLTSGGQSYELRYFEPWEAYPSGSYPSAPTSSATTKYIVGAPLTDEVWYTQAPRDLNSDVATQFGFTSYTVTGVKYGVLEDTTSSAYPYANLTGYFANLDLTSTPATGPIAATPETPVTVALPLVAVGLVGTAVVVRRRRQSAAS